MIEVSDTQIRSLGITSNEVLNWTREAFLQKSKSVLPHKTSITFEDGRKFYNSMPALMPEIGMYGIKIVSRYPERQPSIQGKLLLFALESGEHLATLDATWITAARTGAVAVLAVEQLAKSDFQTVAVMGLGTTGTSFLNVLLATQDCSRLRFKLLSYKDHALKTAAWMRRRGLSDIEICPDHESLVRGSDVLVSSVTVADKLIAEDEWFKPGVLVVPIHTRGFQNCDITFDRVVADDKSHVSGFANFDRFRVFEELDSVILGESSGRTSSEERILAYNIGIALHDVYVGYQILRKMDVDLVAGRSDPVPE